MRRPFPEPRLSVDVLLIRHAAHVQLDATLSGRTPGLSLSEAGRAQAAALAGRLGAEGIAAVQASPLDRTQATARAIAEAAGVEVKTVAALNEVDFGEWAGRTFAELAPDPDWDAWNAARSTARAPGGESMAEAQARMVSHLRATAMSHDGQRIAMVSHCDMIRAAVADILGLSLDHILRFDIAPASVTRIVVGDWGARVVSLNEGAW